MSTTGVSVFDTTLQKTNRWLKDLMQLLEWDDRQKSYLALRATLQALRDRLTIEEVAQLAAQLPMLIRGFYYEGRASRSGPQISEGEIEDVRQILPTGLRRLWPPLTQHTA